MSTPDTVLENIGREPGRITADEAACLLGADDAGFMERLREAAYRVKERHVGRTVYLRGLIEVSNACRCDCHYCGLRRGNRKLTRYCMTAEEIVAAAEWAWRAGYGSVVLQAGERRDEIFTAFIERTVGQIKAVSGGALGVTLSLGEQDRATYARWFRAGAHRYLLRIETTNEKLFRAIHPDDVDFRERRRCLGVLREAGYQVGTGVMVGLPGQTVEDLANDVCFFREADVDMLGLGPYIPYGGTPLADKAGDYTAGQRLRLALRMIAVCRLLMPDINMASTTALDALDPHGRELGLLAGANILMPNVTPERYRRDYQLYPGKPGIFAGPEAVRDQLVSRIEAIGETVGFDRWGDSPHAAARKERAVGYG